MTKQQNLSNQPTQSGNPFYKLRQFFTQNVIMAGAVGGFVAPLLGFSADLAAFWTFLSPRSDTDSYKAGWVLVKITGWSETSYEQAEKMDGLGRFFVQRLRGTSRLTPMIYTDQKPSENTLNNGVSQEDDVSVLINVDYTGKFPGLAKDSIEKRNSQTFQARLIQAYSSKKPVCLFVYGIRNNDRSKFLNILQFREVQPEQAKEYNTLTAPAIEDDATAHTKLVDLTGRACGKETLYK